MLIPALQKVPFGKTANHDECWSDECDALLWWIPLSGGAKQ